ncbi:MAG: hypothetical protein EA401_09100 [Planctomycetota bacterium]|nr:MAG: hypothetical protein EA401_09100 [Planctomycetota bacterium]
MILLRTTDGPDRLQTIWAKGILRCESAMFHTERPSGTEEMSLSARWLADPLQGRMDRAWLHRMSKVEASWARPP